MLKNLRVEESVEHNLFLKWFQYSPTTIRPSRKSSYDSSGLLRPCMSPARINSILLHKSVFFLPILVAHFGPMKLPKKAIKGSAATHEDQYQFKARSENAWPVLRFLTDEKNALRSI